MKLGAYRGAMVEENGRDLLFSKPPKYKGNRHSVYENPSSLPVGVKRHFVYDDAREKESGSPLLYIKDRASKFPKEVLELIYCIPIPRLTSNEAKMA
jgi:hypothetical protein